MNEIAPCTRTELNNNSGDDHMKTAVFRSGYASSPTSSEISDDLEVSSVLSAAPSEHQDNPTESTSDGRRFRSMSDGAAVSPDGDGFEVFPSLPDDVLRKLGLLGENPRGPLTEEEVENKFVSLSLAFTIDAATIKDRSDRQRRYRDQTETNLNVEIERLIEKANRLQPLCVDADTTELLTGLLAHVDIIIRACAHAAISAERFGAVQHEERLAESVQLMISHVNALKLQRDSARRQLQYTKRVLQDTSPADSVAARHKMNHLNGRLITKRRASIATITQPTQETAVKTPQLETRKITRRTSELAIRGSALNRTNRPSRLELGMDLVKIRENARESTIPSVVTEEIDEEIEESNSYQSNEECKDSQCNHTSRRNSSPLVEPDPSTLSLKHRLLHRVRRFGRYTANVFGDWISQAPPNEIFCFCALMCFSLSIITMANILVELEYAKRDSLWPFYLWKFNSLWSGNELVEYSKEAVGT